MIRDGFSCILGFKISPGEAPWTTLQEEIYGEILDLIILANLCATMPSPPPTPHHTDAKNVICWESAYDNIRFCDLWF